jgi:hypothetical protein
MAKLMLGLLTAVVSAAILAVLMLIAWLFNSDGVTAILLLVWLSVTGFVRFALMHYAGYLVKAGHVAVIAEAAVTGRIPDDQVAYGKKMVTERFLTSNVYFAVDKLVAGAVKQLQGYLQKAGNKMDFIPGMDTLVRAGKLFIDISLGYVDECCLGYTFHKRDQNAYKSAADGVTIYAQNWKKLFGGAAKTALWVILLLCGVTLAAFIVLGLLCKLLGLPGYLGFLMACVIAWAVKFAFIDSYILVNMMTAYMETATTTTPAVDLYGQLAAASSKFRELYEKGKDEVLHSSGMQTTEPIPTGRPSLPAEAGEKTENAAVFCGGCGEKNVRSAKFCGKCGTALSA